MKHRKSTPNERVWCTTQLAKFCFSHSIGRTHSWRFQFFKARRSCPGSVGSPVPFSTLSSAIADDFHHERVKSKGDHVLHMSTTGCAVYVGSCVHRGASLQVPKGSPIILYSYRSYWLLLVMLYTYSLLNGEPSSNIPIPKGVSSCTGAWLSAYLDVGTPPPW